MNHRAILTALFLTVITGISLVVAEEDQLQPIQEYEGAAHIGNLDQITVVYPAAAGLSGVVNRDSADLKASYLSRRYGVKTTIAPDNGVTSDQLAGHLLVLGWDNRLLGNDLATRPWTRTAEKLNFLGVEGPLPTDDLLFISGSPYNERKYMIFWSRIDPEMERFLSFPFIGSDWAIYRNYFVLNQGRFDQNFAWPPVRDPLAEHDSSFLLPPLVRRSGHYALHYEPDLINKGQEQRILAARESALIRAGEMLGVAAPDDFEIKLYLYPDEKVKYDRIGVADPTHSEAPQREVYMTVRHASSANPHEEIHVLAARAYGGCSLSMMYEGLATLLESRAKPEQLDSWAALMIERDGVPAISGLIDDEGLRRLATGGLGLPAAALMLRWLEEVGGADALQRTYGLTRSTAPGIISQIAGVDSLSVADEQFQAWMAKRGEEGKTELEYRKAIGQGDSRSEVGDFAGAAEGFANALAIKPDDTMIRYRLAQCQIEVEKYEEAAVHLKQLLEMAPPPEPSWLGIFSRYQLARIDDFSGNRDAAIAGYRAVLEMPDEHEAHRRAREGLGMLGEPGD